MGFKKDDSSRIPKSSFISCLVFYPVSTFRGTVHYNLFFIKGKNRPRQRACAFGGEAVII